MCRLTLCLALVACQDTSSVDYSVDDCEAYFELTQPKVESFWVDQSSGPKCSSEIFTDKVLHRVSLNGSPTCCYGVPLYPAFCQKNSPFTDPGSPWWTPNGFHPDYPCPKGSYANP